MSKNFTCIDDIIEMAVKAGDSENYNCNIELKVDGETYSAYSVDISCRELTFNCEDAYISYDVNGNGLNDWIELLSIEVKE